MSHAQGQRYAEGRAAQPCARSAASKTTSRCGLGACSSVLHFPSTGVSLPGTGTAPKGAGSCFGSQTCFYCQALPDPYRQTQGLCIFDGTDPERNRQPSCFDFAQPRAKTWLKNRRVASGWPFGWSTGLIAWWRKNSLKPMNCWCLNGAGSLTAPLPVARRS